MLLVRFLRLADWDDRLECREPTEGVTEAEGGEVGNGKFENAGKFDVIADIDEDVDVDACFGAPKCNEVVEESERDDDEADVELTAFALSSNSMFRISTSSSSPDCESSTSPNLPVCARVERPVDCDFPVD